ncbi:MAG: hypothetical protein L3J56_04315 [Bacteroidales bacterium]|nr:hypothetical protein [Bacteroidales bacterium]
MNIKKYKTSEERIVQASENSDALKLYIETYGCQMNVSDSEVVNSIMLDNGFALTNKVETADVIFINTCALINPSDKLIFTALDS